MPDFAAERALAGAAGGPRNILVAGVDEAGRGPLAGPVVAAAVCFPGLALPPAARSLIDDSKKLSPARRNAAFAAILEAGTVGTGAASVAEIDRINILQATLLAMQRAVSALAEALAEAPAAVLVDGNRAPDLPCPARPVVGGDRLSLSIAAASIVAKVTRDRIMARLAAEHPGYGWERNAGYGVAAHRAALATLGPTPHHRRTFAPVREMLADIE